MENIKIAHVENEGARGRYVRLAMTKETRRSIERTRHAHMALSAAAAAAGRQHYTRRRASRILFVFLSSVM